MTALNDQTNNQSNDLEIPAEIRSFIEGLLADANMASLDNEMKEEMIKEVFARLDNYMTAAIVDNLPEDKLEAFIKLNEDKKSKEEIETYLKDNMPNAQDVFAKTFQEFRDLYLGGVTVARNAPTQV